VIASAAAPVYFHPYRIGDSVYVDGALIANNPTEIAYKEAQTLWKDRPLGMRWPIDSKSNPNFITFRLHSLDWHWQTSRRRSEEQFLVMDYHTCQ